MKRLVILFLILCLIFGFCGCLDGVSFLYDKDARINGFYVSINETANCCFVSSYDCEEYKEGMEITIPDDYNGIPITRVGGYFGRGVPRPFVIGIYEYLNAPEGSEYDCIMIGDYTENNEYDVCEVPFILNIGKNIKSIEYVLNDEYIPHINEDDSVTLYHAVVEINCSLENKHFYSKDGKLYEKKTDELITDFPYKKTSS